MVNDQLAEQLAQIDVAELPGGDLTLVGIETRAPDDKVSFDCSRSERMMKLYHAMEWRKAAEGPRQVHAGYLITQLRVFYVQLNPFRLKGGKVGKGSLHPFTQSRFKCRGCGQVFVESFVDERRKKTAKSFFCAKCGPSEGVLDYCGQEVPPMSQQSEGARRVLEAFGDTDWGHPAETPDVIPQVMCVYDGPAPALWVPKSPLEMEAANRLEERGRFMLPYWLASRVDAPAVGVICLARPSAAGWVSLRYFQPMSEAAGEVRKDRFNPGYSQHLPPRHKPRAPQPDMAV